MDVIYDLAIIGGGINGCAIARDAAGRGLSVILCERNDLAGATSSSSTKLIHGGLRYLEYYEFSLVRKALIEREVLLRSAPHIIWPMRFVLPYDKGLRPAWMLRVGLFIYDYMGGRKLLPPTKTVKFNQDKFKDILEAEFDFGYEYSDCWVEDARLVILNAVDAAHHGAHIYTQTEVVDIRAEDSLYAVDYHSEREGKKTIKARAIINSAGPWVDEILKKIEGSQSLETDANPVHGTKDNPEDHLSENTEDNSVRLVKGSHIIIPRKYAGDHAYIFQNADNRIIFAIPYEQDFTLIGTTDVPYDHREGPVKISPEEITYLCDAASEYFSENIEPDDVVWTYSGVRPLYDDKSPDASAVTRDYVLDIEHFAKEAPFVSVYGGKITTSRKLAEHVMAKLSGYFPNMKPVWTQYAHLPGGDIIGDDFEAFYNELRVSYPHINPKALYRMARAYGTRITMIIGEAGQGADLGESFGGGVSEAEICYLYNYEWARRPEDVLWRRSKLGLHMTPGEIGQFNIWFKKNFMS